MIELLKQNLLEKLLVALKVEPTCWTENNQYYYISIHQNDSFYSYVGIRFIKNRNYVIPFINWSDSPLASITDERKSNQIVNDEHFANLTSMKSFVATKCEFDEYTNISQEVAKPDESLILKIKNDTAYTENLLAMGIYDDFFETDMCESWELISEFCGYQLTEDDVDFALKPLLEDLAKKFTNLFFPYLEMVSNLKGL